MTWQDFYLVCFVVGFASRSSRSFRGAFHCPLGHGAWLGRLLGHGAPGRAAPRASRRSTRGASWRSSPGSEASGTCSTGAGPGRSLAVLFGAAAAGIVGAFLVFVFVAKVLLERERPLDAVDFHMEGVLGRVTVAIRPGRHRRDRLFAGRDAAVGRRAKRVGGGDSARGGSRRHALRQGHRVRASLGGARRGFLGAAGTSQFGGAKS